MLGLRRILLGAQRWEGLQKPEDGVKAVAGTDAVLEQ